MEELQFLERSGIELNLNETSGAFIGKAIVSSSKNIPRAYCMPDDYPPSWEYSGERHRPKSLPWSLCSNEGRSSPRKGQSMGEYQEINQERQRGTTV